MQLAGDISSQVQASIEKHLPGELKQFYSQDIAAELTARLALPIQGLLGGAFGSVVTEALSKFLAKVMPDELKGINKALDPVAEFADGSSGRGVEVLRAGGPVPQRRQKAGERVPRQEPARPDQGCDHKPLQEAIGSRSRRSSTRSARPSATRSASRSTTRSRASRKFAKSVGCSIKKLFGGKKC